MMRSDEQKGLISVLGCYVIWGLFPLYWWPLVGQPIGADQMLAERVTWAAITAFVFLLATRNVKEVWCTLRLQGALVAYFWCALAIGLNWLLYLYAIASHQVLQASLGYFICPLISILLARIFLRESLRLGQWLAIGLALIGVLWLAMNAHGVPWLALGIAGSFGVYGLVRKKAPGGVLVGLSVETLLLAPLALGYLIYLEAQGKFVFTELSLLAQACLLGSGLITLVPLLLFAWGVRRISLSTTGVLQYLSPTMQFLLGWLVFHEPFDGDRFIGYLWVWAGVVLFLWQSWARQKGQK